MTRKPRGWTFCRALAVAYGLAGLPLAIACFIIFPLLAAVTWKVTRRRPPRGEWWPLTSWFQLASTLPRLAAWLERRLCRPAAPPGAD